MSITQEEKTELNKKAKWLIQSSTLTSVNDDKAYDFIRERNKFVGFGHYYLSQSSEPDEKLYTKLIQIDAKLGTTDSEQLFGCLSETNRSDLIQV